MMPQYVVLKTMPKGQQPGEVVDLNDDEARVFLAAEAVRPVDASVAPTVSVPKKKGKYARRDLKAEGSE